MIRRTWSRLPTMAVWLLCLFTSSAMAFDDGEICFRIEFGAYSGDHLFADRPLDLLALAVAGVEAPSQGHGF